MPLLTSPVDGSPMRQIKRFGIELDVCPTSGGVWLDKGELEKLMALIQSAAEAEAEAYAPLPQRAYAARPGAYSHDGDDYHRLKEYRSHKEHDGHHYKGKYKKKGPLHQVLDIFDF